MHRNVREGKLAVFKGPYQLLGTIMGERVCLNELNADLRGGSKGCVSHSPL